RPRRRLASRAHAGRQALGRADHLSRGARVRAGRRLEDHVMSPGPGTGPPEEPTMAVTPRPFQEKNVTLPNGLRVHYYEWAGPGPTLVLLHPSSGYGRMWEWTADALGPRCHVYALDQRGHGDSGRPDGDYSAEEYAGDLALFFDALSI